MDFFHRLKTKFRRLKLQRLRHQVKKEGWGVKVMNLICWVLLIELEFKQ
jgi:hypothetical protein